MRRREFIAGMGGAAAWPLAALAQGNAMRRVGVLMTVAADEPLAQANLAAFAQGLQELGWSIGRNIRIEYRWGGGDVDLFRKYAAELVALKPDVVLATAGSVVGALQQVSRSVPIVFVTTIDPVGGGWVESLAHPGTNATGFASSEFSLSAKWLDLLKQIAPGSTRVAVIRDAAVPAGIGGFTAIQSAARSYNVEVAPIGVRDAGEIERGIAALAREANSGLIVAGPPSSLAKYFNLIVSLAARYRLPTVYSNRIFVVRGGLISYAADSVDQYRRAASYIDRILKGEKPADLPVQLPTKLELVINLKTAKALGLTIPPALLATADEVIE